MRKYSYFLTILFLHQFTLNAQWVTIPDTNFVNKLTQIIPNCMNGNQMDTTCTQVVNMQSLDVHNLGIYDLTGVQYFDSLIYLGCHQNYISTLPNLPQFLETINCSFNLLTGITTLPPLLKYLYCSNNQISNISSVPNSLLYLYCGTNQLSNLPLLPNTLQVMGVSENEFNNLPTLPDSLLVLTCYENYLTNLPTLPNNLQQLYCGFNLISNIPSLPNTLNTLSCSSNPITSLPTLSTSLELLFCNACQISWLPNLPSSLISLDCSGNLISSLPALPNGLKSLKCLNNYIYSIPVIPDSLESLYCSNNFLTTLGQVPNEMSQFFIDNNDIVCVTNLPIVLDSIYADMANNPIVCVPNQTNYSLGLPLCLFGDIINNPNNCIEANLAGHVFTDQNNNCNYENFDLPTNNIPVKLFGSQNNFLALSNTVNGVFSFGSLLPDTFIIKVFDNILPVSLDCGQLNAQTVVLDSSNQTILGIDFPIICDGFDIKTQSMYNQGFVFPGQIHRLNTHITNNETWYNLDCNSSAYTGTVSIEVNGPVSYHSVAPNALIPTINGNIFTYTIADFVLLTPLSFGLNFKTDTTASAGDQICVHVSISSTPIDADTTNNAYDFCYQVVNSYDPNMKEVYPDDVAPGYDDWFTYTIHFQNTGSAPAFNIQLKDTLDNSLDLSTFEVLGYSHPSNVRLNDHILSVSYSNIMLPDSTTDYEGSKGYFQYRIKPKPNLPLGTSIENTAYIYFDYNTPIITNTTQNNFVTGLTEKIRNSINEFTTYPNPSNGIFNFKDTKNLKQVEVYNLFGELILSQGHQKQINLSSFSRGIYYAKINGDVVVKLVKE